MFAFGQANRTRVFSGSAGMCLLNKSIAAMVSARLRRNVRRVCDGDPRWRTMYVDDRRLGDREPELQQFAMDAWGTPKQLVKWSFRPNNRP
jgi:hypothetical protein